MKRALITAVLPVAMLLVCGVLPISQLAAQDATPEGGAAAPQATPATPAAPAADAPATTVTPTTEKPIQEIVDAVELFRQRDVEGALKKLKKAVKEHPDLPPAQVVLAEFFIRANLAPQAQGLFEQAVIDFPDDPEAYYLLGAFAIRDRRVAEARLLYEKAESLLPGLKSAKRKKILEPQVLAGLAMTSSARSDWTDAQKKLEAWLKLEPESTGAMQQLAQNLLQQKNEQAALDYLVKAYKIDAKLLSPEASLAQYYAMSNQQDKAKQWMIAALNAKPKDIKTRLLATRWAFETAPTLEAEKSAERMTEAKKQADAAVKLDPQSVDAQFYRGLIALFQKDYTTAEEYFQNAHLLSPKDFRVSNSLALTLIEQKSDEKRQRALEYAEDNARKYQKQAEALSTYGWVLYKLGRLDDADKMLRNAISVSGGSVSADTAYYLARLLRKKGGADNEKAAKQWLERALATPVPFQNRDDAKALLEELKK
jgi:Tfp pilus assembly protein PilF